MFSAQPAVLIVDDEPLVAMLLEDQLIEIGCKPMLPAYATVQSALAFIAESALDAAIVDVSLGAEDSAPIADALIKRKIPFAFATGHARAPSSARFAATPVLSKPFDLDALTQMMALLLKK